ncbi:hypothetical protein CDD83_2697 [Cordyceps sp. RAO-2017]|nr:hypothetical protein CDD83_2697 [Cordyceps sp. RAO-2017]
MLWPHPGRRLDLGTNVGPEKGGSVEDGLYGPAVDGTDRPATVSGPRTFVSLVGNALVRPGRAGRVRRPRSGIPRPAAASTDDGHCPFLPFVSAPLAATACCCFAVAVAGCRYEARLVRPASWIADLSSLTGRLPGTRRPSAGPMALGRIATAESVPIPGQQLASQTHEVGSPGRQSGRGEQTCECAWLQPVLKSPTRLAASGECKCQPRHGPPTRARGVRSRDPACTQPASPAKSCPCPLDRLLSS